MNKENIIVSAEVKTYLSDLYSQIEYELREDYKDGLEKALQQIDQLTNNWNELEKYMKTEWNNKNYGAEYKIALSKVYNKLQELKGKQMIEDLDIYEDIEDDEDNLE